MTQAASSVQHTAERDLSLVYTPERTVFYTPSGPATGYDLLHAAHKLARHLPDCPVVSLCQDIWSFTVLFLAVVLRGQYLLLSSDRTVSRLTDLAQDYGAVCVALENDLPTEGLPPNSLVLPIGARQTVSQDGVHLPANPVIDSAQLVAVVFTSGSSGQPVGHRKHWGALVERSCVARDLLDPEQAPATAVGTVPPYHMYGFETLVLQAIHTRGRTTTGPCAYPADWQALLERSPAPRILVTTPLQLRSLLRANLAVPHIARVISAAAPMDMAVAHEAELTLTAPVMEIYGATEIGSVAMRHTTQTPLWQLYKGVVLEVAGEDASISAPGAPAFPLSDFVEPLPERHFKLIGRKSDIVKLAAKRTSLAALNTVLLAVPGVMDGAFLAPKENQSGALARMQVFAVAPDLSAEQIMQHLREQLDPAFLPRRVVLVEAMPRNSVGKLTVQALRQLAAQEADGVQLGTLCVSPDHPCLPGHFPGQPVVPGVVVLEEGLAQAKGAPTHILQVKFMQPVLPGQQVVFFLKTEGARARLTGRVGGNTVLRATFRVAHA
ncbi:AMP-binding protein [Acetobacter orientalis]|uniref:AMP-binding protein n=1 Tax=Acetobacter orientalis TaxID=146474 RepID=UPI0020A357ED|nr:AMP-binding protein [Acetobacter orientalis]MCP1220332.1 AMP-binding protein [Acetobacter orientalis]